MEDIFSTSSKIIEKQIELEEDDQQQELKKFIERDFDSYFDINKIVEWLTEKKFSRIALQFPDEMLNNSIRVCARLKEAAPNVLFFILADTSYGSCCADVVAAQHYNADALIHFGHSCLSPVEKLPVFYVFEKLLVNLDYVEAELNRLSGLNPAKKLVVLYDIAYFYLYDELVKKFSKNPNIYVSRIKMPNESDGENVEEKLLFSRTFPKDLKTANDSHEFVYIGHKENTLTSLMFYFNRSKFYKFDTSMRGQSQVTEMPFSRTNRELMRRYYLIEKARDTRIFGILVGTMSVANYREAIRHVEGLLKKAGRRYYSFLIGKLNCPKLNNFMEVDMYVMISCNENSLINSKELNKPIITVFELEMAFNSARVWGEEFVCDFRQLLPGSEHYLETKLSDREADVSLITGETRFFNRDINHNSENQKSLANRNDGLSLMHYSGAGEFLQNRSWVGLEQNLGQTEVTKAVEGKKGIAANYEDEFKT